MAILEQASVLTDAIRPVPAKELEQRLGKFSETHGCASSGLGDGGHQSQGSDVLFHGDDAGGSAHHHSGGCGPVGAEKFRARLE